jgi:integrase
MARPVGSRDRWPSRKHGSGYVRPIGPIAWLCYGQRKRSSGLRWMPENRKECVAMLDTWIDELKADPASRRMFTTVFAEYVTEYLPTRSAGAAKMIATAFTAYFPDTPEVAALRFRTPDLRAYLLRRHRTLAATMKRTTLKGYRSAVSRLFTAFAIPRAYIDANPCDVLERAAGQTGKVVASVWTRAEVETIAAHAPSRLVGLRWRWAYLTGMRPSEIARMRWEDMHDGGLTIYGAAKGTAKPGDIERDGLTLRPRAFVLRPPRASDAKPIAAWMREMIALLAEARGLGDGAYVWGSAAVEESTQLRARQFETAAKAAGVERHGRRLYDLRASAGDMMETELGLPNQLIADLSGHDAAMRMAKYRPARSTERLEKRITDRGDSLS